jgi:hypothetical protein
VPSAGGEEPAVVHPNGSVKYYRDGVRVHELRGHHEDDGTIVIDELLLGRGALLQPCAGRVRTPGASRWRQ